jgi:hypothetical protein
MCISHVRVKYDEAGKKPFEDTNAWVALSEMFTNILRDPGLNSTYIQFKVDWLAKRNRYGNDTRDAVQQYLTLNANGTFLWVALVCQELSNISGWKAQQRLTALPGLDALY